MESSSQVVQTYENDPPVAAFTKLSDCTAEDFRRAQLYFSRAATPEKMADRMMDLLKTVKGVNMGCRLDLYEHSLQTATRALRDGADDETVVCALLHDVGELLTPACHGEIAGSLLRPYILPKNYWILIHHEVFQAYYYGEACNINKNLRDRFKDHPYYEDCRHFCSQWDEKAFDPAYDTLSLDDFGPMVLDVLSRKPYSMPGQTESSELNAAKAALTVYDFADWKKQNGLQA